jgi:hypothetical protein
MAILDSSNVVNGNTISASDISALYDAFSSGGGYSVSISGSLTGSASTATSASYSSVATSATNLSNFQVLDRAGNPTDLTNPRPIAVSCPLTGGSGSIDLGTLTPPIGAGATTLGTDIFVVGQSVDNSGTRINSADTVEIEYTQPARFNVTSSNSAATHVILTGWTTA